MYYYLTHTAKSDINNELILLWERDEQNGICVELKRVLKGDTKIIVPGFTTLISRWQSDIIGENEDPDLLIEQATMLVL